MDMIGAIETALGREAKKDFLPMQLGDVPATFADVSSLRALCGYAAQGDAGAGHPKVCGVVPGVLPRLKQNPFRWIGSPHSDELNAYRRRFQVYGFEPARFAEGVHPGEGAEVLASPAASPPASR